MRMIMVSILPPIYPENRPIIAPPIPPSRRVKKATSKEIRAPNISRVRISRPKGSVPRGWERLPPSSQKGGCRRSVSEGRVGDSTVNTLAKIAIKTTRAMMSRGIRGACLRFRVRRNALV
jgi:hypothetical protein